MAGKEVTVQFDIALPTKDGSYLSIYTTSYPVAKNFAHWSFSGGFLFDFECLDADVLTDGGYAQTQQSGPAVGILSVFYKNTGGTAYLEGIYPVYNLLVDYTSKGGADDRLRIRTGPKMTPIPGPF